ncbi:MAG TPA: hypothetical protein VK369_03900 [Segetibacter sp.]|nr:hypothetical protein [Segetibacter sp.]
MQEARSRQAKKNDERKDGFNFYLKAESLWSFAFAVCSSPANLRHHSSAAAFLEAI